MGGVTVLGKAPVKIKGIMEEGQVTFRIMPGVLLTWDSDLSDITNDRNIDLLGKNSDNESSWQGGDSDE